MSDPLVQVGFKCPKALKEAIDTFCKENDLAKGKFLSEAVNMRMGQAAAPAAAPGKRDMTGTVNGMRFA